MKNINFKFSYNWVVTSTIDPNTQKQVHIPHDTTVKIFSGNDVVASATVKLYHKDQFVKEVGRKRAIKKAIDSLGIDKEQRKEIWDAYLNRK